ncbi:TPM domain-containing protein [Dietzia aerolata]|uniref:TPM domain-containing protein n=1 Tax=Dietzia aerolata TaxID=595984 RepID=UPI003627207F
MSPRVAARAGPRRPAGVGPIRWAHDRLLTLDRYRRTTPDPGRAGPGAGRRAPVVTAALGRTGASAEPPTRLQQQVTDSAGVLGGRTGEVEARIAELRSTDSIKLWVTYVNTLDGIPVRQWAEQTGQMSDLGMNDALLVVAVQDTAYWFEFADETGSTSANQREAQRIAADDIEPALVSRDWAGAAIGAADGLEAQGSGSEVSPVAMLVGIVVVILLVVALLVFTSRRRKARTSKQVEAADDIPGDDTARMSALPTEVLDARARAGLGEADQAVEASATALATATGEFGELRTRPFRQALEAARAEVTAAHALVQRLDDDIPETPDQRKAMLLEVAARAERAERGLEGQASAFAEMRDLLINGAGTLDALTRRAISLRARLPEAEKTMASLQEQFPPAVLSSISDNVTLAARLLDEADSEAARARQELARPVGQQGSAVDAIESAEDGILQAEKLITSVDHASDDIATARRDLDALITEVDEELAIAGRLLASTDVSDSTSRSLSAVATDARTAVDEARRGETDPLGTFSRLIDVDRELDEALAAAGHEAEAADRARAARQAALHRARGPSARPRTTSAAADTSSVRPPGPGYRRPRTRWPPPRRPRDQPRSPPLIARFPSPARHYARPSPTPPGPSTAAGPTTVAVAVAGAAAVAPVPARWWAA